MFSNYFVIYLSQRDLAAFSMKAYVSLIFFKINKSLLYFSEFTQNLNELYTSTFLLSHSIHYSNITLIPVFIYHFKYASFQTFSFTLRLKYAKFQKEGKHGAMACRSITSHETKVLAYNEIVLHCFHFKSFLINYLKNDLWTLKSKSLTARWIT